MDPPITDAPVGDLPALGLEDIPFSYSDWLAPASPGGTPLNLDDALERHINTPANSIPAASTSTASATSTFPQAFAVDANSTLVSQDLNFQLPPLTVAPSAVFPLGSMATNTTQFAMPDLNSTGPYAFNPDNTTAIYDTNTIDHGPTSFVPPAFPPTVPAGGFPYSTIPSLNMEHNNLPTPAWEPQYPFSNYQLAPPSVPTTLDPAAFAGVIPYSTPVNTQDHNSASPVSDDMFYPEVAAATAPIEPLLPSFPNDTQAHLMSNQPYAPISTTTQPNHQPGPVTQNPVPLGSEPQPANAAYTTYQDYPSLLDMPCNYLPGVEGLQLLGDHMTYVQHEDGRIEAHPKWKATLTGRNTVANTPPLPTFAEIIKPGRILLCMINEVLIKSGCPPLITEYPAYSEYIRRHKEENPHIPITSCEFWASDFPKRYYEEAKAQGMAAHEPEYLPALPATTNQTATSGPIEANNAGSLNTMSALGPSPLPSGTPSLEMGSSLNSTSSPYTPATVTTEQTVQSQPIPPSEESSTNATQNSGLVHRSPRQSSRQSPYSRPGQKWRDLPRKDRPELFYPESVIGLTMEEIADIASRKTRAVQKKLARIYQQAKDTDKWLALPKEFKCSMCKKRDYPCLVPVLQLGVNSWTTTRGPHCSGCESNPSDCGLRQFENGQAVAAYTALYRRAAETAKGLVYICKTLCPILPKPVRFPLVSGKIPG